MSAIDKEELLSNDATNKSTNSESDSGTPEQAQQSVQTSTPYTQAASLIGTQQALLGEMYKAEEEKQAERQKQYKEYIQAANDAQKNGYSAMLGILDSSKPKYDEKKERRLRSAAIIQSLGDMLSAAARGYFAYRGGGKGQGYVPNITPNSPLKSLEEISRMQKEYQQRDEAWRNMRLNLDIKNEEAKQAAAAKLAERAYDEVKRGENALTKYKELALKYGQDVAMMFAKQIFADDAQTKRLEAQAAEGAANRESRERIAAAARAAKSQGKKLTEEEEYNNLVLSFYLEDNPLGDNVVTTEGVKTVKNARGEDVEVPYSNTRTTPKSLGNLKTAELNMLKAQALNDAYATAAATYMLNGKSREEAKALAKEYVESLK